MFFRSSADLPHNLELDFTIRAIGARTTPEVQNYVDVQARLAWRISSCIITILLFIILGMPGRAAPARATEETTLELAEKATYLYKLGAFVDWTPAAAEYPSGAYVICVIGHDPFGVLLDRAVAGQKVGGHPIVLRRLDVVTGSPGCSIAYITGSALQSVADALSVLQTAPVLTVIDGAAPTFPGPVINFVLKDAHVRFAIDLQAAAAHGLVVSSKLLSLAVVVRGGRPP